MKYYMEEEREEPLTVECDVTVTMHVRAHLKVDDVNMSIDDRGDGDWNREVDFTNVDWKEVLEDNELVPEGFYITDLYVEPIRW